LDFPPDSATIEIMNFQLRDREADTAYPLTGIIKQIGRSHDCDIVISDPKVSRLHARLDQTEKGWVIVDLESTNGTKVNGKKVAEKLLETGDVIQLGAFNLEYEPAQNSELSDEATRAEEKTVDQAGVLNRLKFWKKQK